MRAAIRLGLAAVAFTLAGVPARADDACRAFKWPVARELKALSAPDLSAVALGGAYPALGQGVTLPLGPQADVAYTLKPTRPPKSNPAYGTDVILADAVRGPLQVALSDDARIDIVQDGKVLRSTAFSGKAGCPGLRKTVRFALGPGPATIRITDSPVATIRLDIESVDDAASPAP